MTKAIQLAKKNILAPNEIDEGQLIHILNSVLSYNVDSADLYLQSSHCESWFLEDSIIKGGNYSIDAGVGIRAISGEKTGYAYTDDIELTALQQTANAARSIAKAGQDGRTKTVTAKSAHSLYLPINPISSMSEIEKVNCLKEIDEFARKQDKRVKRVIANINCVYESVLMLNQHGQLTADIRPLIRLDVSVIVEENGKHESGNSGGGGRYDLNQFLQQKQHINHTKEAVRLALLSLQAKPAPAGLMPVILGPGWPAVLLHEAVGHGLEGDFNRKGSSAYSGQIGERVASKHCTVIDDGTLAKRRGSLNIDDEGNQTQQTILIENGILKAYMQDNLNAKLMNTVSTGNGRRESYAHAPMPRMTNTYMPNGDYDPQEIIRSVDKGLYAVNFSGGQVDITSGKFVFSTSEAYLIEDGKITQPVKDATLIGNGPEVMQKVSMVGNDFALDSGVGVCGKDGQSVPVGVGQPTLKVDSITVGGTK